MTQLFLAHARCPIGVFQRTRKRAIKEIKIEIIMFSLNLNGIFVFTMF